jgi:acyl-CoA hydrolase
VAISFPTRSDCACASSFSNYCVAASVDTVDFLRPIEVGTGNHESQCQLCRCSMIIGIRVESENIRTGTINTATSYFTMVSKAKMVKRESPRPYSFNLEEVRRFINCLKQISMKKKKTVMRRF